MDNDESDDILGGRFQVLPPRPAFWADPGRMTLLLGFVAIITLAWVRLGPHFRHWRETRYRKAMRRRHGIPDDDYRPFNVAYAAALQARKKREGKSHGVAQQVPQGLPVEGGSQLPSSVPNNMASEYHYPSRISHSLPYVVKSIPNEDVAPLPPPTGMYLSHQNGHAATVTQAEARSHNHVQDVAQPSTVNHPPLAQETVESLVSNNSAAQASRPTAGRLSTATRTRHGKHALDDEMNAEQETLAKKSRIDVEELIGGDEEPGWRGDQDDMEVDSHVQQSERRGSKRTASSEDDEGPASSRSERHEKRARKVSLDKSAEVPDYHMEEDEVGEDVEDSLGAARGKKRDRAEAGSTFGGDDSIMDDDEKPHRQRRRRTVSTKLSQSSSRGQKRVRDVDSHDSDDSEADRPKRAYARKKRGKRSEEEIVPLSNDPLCKGRRIGEEWESNGIHYKVGPNGQRLRQELVKKSRSRFPMPSDSQHPDRRANLDVYVEMWLSEEEYQVAKERHDLAWQDAPPTPPESHTLAPSPGSPSITGKSLLWSSTMASRESPVKRGPLRQSVNTNVGLRLSVLAPSPISSSLRISSVYQTPASPASDSPKLQKSKSYSKWEKQDLEAAAMSKIREKQQLQQTKAAPSALPLFSTPLSNNPAPKATQAALQSAAPSFGCPPASTFAPANQPVKEAPKASTPGSIPAAMAASQPKPTAPSFSFPTSTSSSASIPPAASTTPANTTPVSQTSTPVPNHFAKPATPASLPVPTAPVSTNGVRDFFAKPAGPSAAGNILPSAPTFSFASTPAPGLQTTQPAPNPARAANDSSKPTETKQVPGSSLLSRLGMGPPPPAQASSSSSFSFGKPTPTPTSTASGTSSASTAPAFGSSGNGANASDSVPPKFSFGATSKPAASAQPAASDPNGPTAHPSASSSTSTPSSTTMPRFSFGVNGTVPQSAPSVPGAASSSPFQNSASNTGANNSSVAKPTFAFGASGTPNLNAFGGASSSAAKPSPFGAAPGSNATPFTAAAGSFASPSNVSSFGAPPNVASAPAGVPKSAFSFGNTATSSAAPTPNEASKPAFSLTNDMQSSSSAPFFGGGASQDTTTPKSEVPVSKPAFSFASSSTPKFGTPSSSAAFGPTSAPGAASGSKATLPFGNSAGNATAQSFTITPTSTMSKPPLSFNFGASNGGGSNSTPAAPTPPTFGFGATPSSSNATAPATSSPFGAPPVSQPGPSSFGFGTSSGPFSFGSNAGQNTPK
ncbi:hypothetical protein BC628DRAFT_1419875 [Trametes gibbosa]|nr:hypothetical protein BC628DRAFT_1419875 [Trametes gibbosa]